MDNEVSNYQAFRDVQNIFSISRKTLLPL